VGTSLSAGDACECKPREGLGSWQFGVVVAVQEEGRRTRYTVSSRGRRYELQSSAVRAPRSGRVAAATAKELKLDDEVARALSAGVHPEKKPRRRRSREGALIRDDEYLAFVRRQPCMQCGRTHLGVDAHHYGPRGTGQKTSDYRTVPLCSGPDGCHAHFHQHGVVPKFALDEHGHERTVAWFHEEQVRLLLLYFAGGG